MVSELNQRLERQSSETFGWSGLVEPRTTPLLLLSMAGGVIPFMHSRLTWIDRTSYIVAMSVSIN